MLVDKNDSTQIFGEIVISNFGVGRVLLLGQDNGSLHRELVSRGNSIVAISTLANLLIYVRDLNGTEEVFDSIVCRSFFESLSEDQIDECIRVFYGLTKQNLLLRISYKDKYSSTSHGGDMRLWWEKKCLEGGFRKHFGYYNINSYESLNHHGDEVLIPMEKINRNLFEQYSLQALERERILHMDMLRELGRRGDAHNIRYKKASEYIRPGDVVLDIACGLGYGSYIVYHNSLASSVLGMDLSESGIKYAQANYSSKSVQFKVGNAQSISEIPDNSVDFITTFETIEHLPEPEKYLAELHRVLRPSGRIMICAPNDWADETGNDPNPHHFHVYTWNRLRAEFGHHFIMEKGFTQTAGGAMKCHYSPRAWREVAINEDLQLEAEWILLLGMKSPLEGRALPYEETSWSIPESAEFHVASFGRDYINPTLLKGMVTRGMRLTSKLELNGIRAHVLRHYPKDSADYGAALCGIAYDALSKSNLKASEVESLICLIDDYCMIENDIAHKRRWNVSLLFVAAELLKSIEKWEESYSYYKRCSSIDTLPFSPLLGIKTIDALYSMAIIRVSQRRIADARELLVSSLKESERLLTGSWLNIRGDLNKPLPFGYAESSQLLDKASRSAYAINCMDLGADKVHLMFQASGMGYFERVLWFSQEREHALRSSYENLRSEYDKLRQAYDSDLRVLMSRPSKVSLYHCLRFIKRNVKKILKLS